jgi:DNA primase
VSLTKNQLPPWKSWSNKYVTWKELAKSSYQRARQAPFLLSYVSGRGINQETITNSLIGWCDRWITLPVFDDSGKFIDLVVRGTSDSQIRYGIRPRVDNDSNLYADWDLINQSDKVFVCFGIFDRLTLTQCGLPAATGISGKTINPEMFRSLRKTIHVIPDFREEEDALDLVSKLGWRGKMMDLNYPAGCKDLNDILMKYGQQKVLEVLNDGR